MKAGKTKRVALAVVAALALCATMTPGIAVGENRDDLASAQKSKSQKISELKASLEGVSADLREAYLVLSDTREKIPGAEKELAAAEAELSAAQRKAEAKAALLDASEKELSGIQGDLSVVTKHAENAGNSLAELARSKYRGETVPSTLDLLVASATVQEFLDSYRVNEALTRSQASALAQFEQRSGQAKNSESRQNAVRARVAELKQEADRLLAEQREKQAQAQAKRNELAELEKTISEKSALLESRKSEMQSAVDSEQAEYDKITAQIAEIDAANRASAAQGGGQSGYSGGGGFIQPPIRTSLYVTSPFGYRIHPVLGYSKLHYGVDLAAGCGTPQYAAAPGTVASAGWIGGGGNAVTINHGYAEGSSWVTRYMHFSSLNVSPGQYVDRDTVIGYTGSTGISTGCHVHFEVWRDGSVQNPMDYIG